MKKIVVIGVGNLGKRHLEGLLPGKHPMDIYCIDPSPESLKHAEELISGRLPKGTQVQFNTGFSGLPPFIDVAIIATNSGQRLAALTALTLATKVRYLILEKVLFQSEQEYQDARELMRREGITSWVNCPRRLDEAYQTLRNIVVKEMHLHMQVFCNKVGLGSNTVHFLDLFAFLTGSFILSADASSLSTDLVQSKRAGYVEFTGVIRARNEKGHSLSIIDFGGVESSIFVTIVSDRFFIEVFENGEINIRHLDGLTPIQSIKQRIAYQSGMTYQVVDQLLDEATCGLTPYDESAEIHLAFIKSIRAFLAQTKGENVLTVPVT